MFCLLIVNLAHPGEGDVGGNGGGDGGADCLGEGCVVGEFNDANHGLAALFACAEVADEVALEVDGLMDVASALPTAAGRALLVFNNITIS